MALISVVVPAYNSERTVDEVVRRAQAVHVAGHQVEVIVVDDASRDGTWSRIERLPGITALRHERNTGKGGAIRTGLARARGEILVMEDDDLEYDPAQIPSVVAPIIEDRADVVFGSRELEPSNDYILPSYHFGGAFLNLVIGSTLHRRITDSISGTKAFSRRVYQHLCPLKSDGFGIETEIAAKVVRGGFRLLEVPITYRPRTHAQGKNIRWYHAAPILASLARHAIRRGGRSSRP